MKQTVSEWAEGSYQDQLRRIQDREVRSVLSLCLEEADSILQSPEQTDFGNESFFRHRDQFHELVFGHNGPEDEVWNGLKCNRMHLTRSEYEFIINCHQLHHFDSVVESGAGETSRLFKRLGCNVLCIESQEGPWVERAIQAGATVKLVSFDPVSSELDPDNLASALQGQPCDLLFVDSPVGTRNRSKVLDSFLRHLEPRFILIHDAHRDAQNVYRWMRIFELKVLEHLPSWRGLVLLTRGK